MFLEVLRDRANKCIHTCMHICMHICIYMFMSGCACVCVCIHLKILCDRVNEVGKLGHGKKRACVC